MKLKWTRLALQDVRDAHHYIARDNPAAAQVVAQSIRDAAQALTEHPLMGRAGETPGTREWASTGTPYLIVYRIKAQVVEVLRIWHSRQDWNVRR